MPYFIVKKADKEYWENPRMYLTAGPQGPYYLLHSFRATDALDTDNLKKLKIAGTLRYKVICMCSMCI